MIYVKKWVKKKKMSTKKTNIIYLPYFETRIFLDSIVTEQAISIENNARLNKLKEFEAMRVEYLQSDTLAETQSETPTETQSETPTETQSETPTETQSEFLKKKILEIEELEQLVEIKFNENIKSIRYLKSFEVYNKYAIYFSEFKFSYEYSIAVKENVSVNSLYTDQFSKK
jgi:hypothetical protein